MLVFGVFVGKETEPRASFHSHGIARHYLKTVYGKHSTIRYEPTAEVGSLHVPSSELYHTIHYNEGLAFMKFGGLRTYIHGG